VGTIIGAFGLWVLFDREVKRLLVEPSPGAATPPLATTLPGFIAERAGALLIVAGVGAGFVIVIGAGFKISGQPAPAEIAALFYPAIVAFPIIVAVAIRVIAAQRAR
jgi:hypothetical protein